jgi:hypothetical protein
LAFLLLLVFLLLLESIQLLAFLLLVTSLHLLASLRLQASLLLLHPIPAVTDDQYHTVAGFPVIAEVELLLLASLLWLPCCCLNQ